MTIKQKNIIFLCVLCSFYIGCDSPSKVVFDNPRDPEGITYSVPGNTVLNDPGVSVASGTVYTLSWSDAERVKAYILQEATNPTFQNASADTLTETSKSFTHTEQTLTTYYYRAEAINDGYTSGWSTVQDIVVNPLPPEAPVAADPGGSVDSASSYTVRWTSVDRAVYYTIEEAADSSFTGASSQIVTSTYTVFSHDVTVETMFFYRVRANNQGGSSIWSNTVDMMVKKRITDGTINIDTPWAVSSITAYVYYGGSEVTRNNLTHTGARGQADIIITAKDNYRVVLAAFENTLVKYVGSDEDVDVTAGGTTTVDIAMVNITPTMKSPIITGNSSFSINWTSNIFATAYKLEEDDNSSFTSPITVSSSTDTTVSFTNKSAGSYFYRVCCITPYGNSPWSEVKSVVVSGDGTVHIDIPWPE